MHFPLCACRFYMFSHVSISPSRWLHGDYRMYKEGIHEEYKEEELRFCYQFWLWLPSLPLSWILVL